LCLLVRGIVRMVCTEISTDQRIAKINGGGFLAGINQADDTKGEGDMFECFLHSDTKINIFQNKLSHR